MGRIILGTGRAGFVLPVAEAQQWAERLAGREWTEIEDVVEYLEEIYQEKMKTKRILDSTYYFFEDDGEESTWCLFFTTQIQGSKPVKLVRGRPTDETLEKWFKEDGYTGRYEWVRTSSPRISSERVPRPTESW
ncbi:hypothetical protein NM688_g8524 [Phlebia brevispora]|uniref:Uncharacterized protein n=1 Tax=Phlebia brevispora TaxID=194682 RepID=A0ACC1RUB8_9APHY|nr:hypothetical protein NM688_g8524 [Phlebia brevispora]